MVSAIEKSSRLLEDEAESLARKARLAAAVFTQSNQDEVDAIVRAMTLAAIESAYDLAALACQETRMGVVEDKVLKNLVASEFQYHQIRNQKTVGIIREFPEENMVEIAEPVGVILALSPVTNPTSTVIFKSIAAAKTRNSIIFSPHLMAADCSNAAARAMYEAARKAGAPRDFITWVEKSPRLRRVTEILMAHPEIDLIFATGGTQMVKAAYSSGKPALGVGAGNTPVYVHRSAAIPSAAMEIIISKTFDNGTECPSEQTLVIDAEIAEPLLREFTRLGCYVLNADEVERVADVVIDARTGGMNYKWVGQPAAAIALEAGISAPPGVKILLCPLEGELRSHRLAVEKLMPVLGFVVVDSVEKGINRALDINYAGGTGHTAGIFANDDSVIEQYATAINAGRVIVNSPTSIGGLGGVYNHLNTTLSFGCGTGGGNITTDNVGIKNLLNYKRVPKRKNFTITFQTTKHIYINPGSIEHLRNIRTKSAFVVSYGSASTRGHLAQVLDRLPADCRVEVFSALGVEPDWQAIEEGLAIMRRLQPDTIVAIGGGSVLDAAKIMRIFYDSPQLKVEDISGNFLDYRHRMAEFPRDIRTQLVAIPTTSGTGSEVTPFAVFKDSASGRKISLIDDTLIPNVAILDANLTTSLPRAVTIDTAIDALTHALEALVSILSTDYTDGLALEAMRLIFEALPEAARNGDNILTRHKLHNAACLAGMAIGNASVGVNHALAHSLGAHFDIPHGRANGVFLLSTIGYNGEIPAKFPSHSVYTQFVADSKYARAARFLGLVEKEVVAGDTPATSTSDQIRLLRRAVYDLMQSVEQPLSIEELGIARGQLDRVMPGLIRAAMEDMSVRTNPRMILISEVENLLQQSYGRRKRP